MFTEKMKIILALILMLGLGTSVIVPVAGKARATAIWSDFKAFGARVAADPAGERILSLGGENEEENLEALLDRLWAVNDSNAAKPFGIAISFLAALGLILEFKRTKGSEPVDTDNPGNPPENSKNQLDD